MEKEAQTYFVISEQLRRSLSPDAALFQLLYDYVRLSTPPGGPDGGSCHTTQPGNYWPPPFCFILLYAEAVCPCPLGPWSELGYTRTNGSCGRGAKAVLERLPTPGRHRYFCRRDNSRRLLFATVGVSTDRARFRQWQPWKCSPFVTHTPVSHHQFSSDEQLMSWDRGGGMSSHFNCIHRVFMWTSTRQEARRRCDCVWSKNSGKGGCGRCSSHNCNSRLLQIDEKRQHCVVVTKRSQLVIVRNAGKTCCLWQGGFR